MNTVESITKWETLAFPLDPLEAPCLVKENGFKGSRDRRPTGRLAVGLQGSSANQLGSYMFPTKNNALT